MDYLSLIKKMEQITINEKTYETALGCMYAHYYLAIRNLDQEGLQGFQERLEEKLGEPTKIEHNDSKKGRWFSHHEYMVGEFKVTSNFLELANNEKYENSYAVIGLHHVVNSWEEAEPGKRHVLIKLVEYAIPEVMSDALQGFEGWFK